MTTTTASGEAHPGTIVFENSVLQVLDRWLPNEKDPERFWYAREPFMESVQAWDKIPILFAENHPTDYAAFARDPEGYAESIGGRIVGEVRSPRVEVEGHPRLMANVALWDKQAIALQRVGKLSPSTGLEAKRNDQREITGGVVPNHLLVFEERPDSMPKDRGAIIANKETITMTSDSDSTSIVQALKDGFADLKASFKETFGSQQTMTAANGPATPAAPMPAATVQEPDMNEIEQLKNQVETTTAELKNRDEALTAVTTERDALKAQNEELGTRLANMETELADFKAKQDEAAFQDFLANKVPPGKKADEAAVTALREGWTTDKAGTISKVLDAVLANKEGPSGQTGVTDVALGNKDGEARRKVGSLNPVTGKWE